VEKKVDKKKTEEIMKEMGKRLKAMRTALDMTQIDVIQEVNKHGYDLAQPTYSKLETGNLDTLPGGEILLGLSEFFKVTIDEILGRECKHPELTVNFMSPEANKVSIIVDSLTPAHRKDVFEYAEFVKDLEDIERRREDLYKRHLRN
jgi:transcriptional regulator with XRE-family HTH domain